MVDRLRIDSHGSIVVGDVRFDPLTLQEAVAITDESSGMALESIEFDVSNSSTANPSFFGYLGIFFNGVGNWCFIDWKEVSNKSYIRMSNQVLGMSVSENRKNLILSVAGQVKKMHDSNLELELNKWKQVDDPLPQRVQFEQVKSRQPYSV